MGNMETSRMSPASGTGSDQRSHPDVLQLVGFHLGDEEYGLDILCVQEIIRAERMTRVPNSPSFVHGVINLRGRVIPVIDLRRCFGLEDRSDGGQNRIVVVEARGAVVGLLVDSVSEVLRVPADAVESPPRLGKAEWDYVSSIGKLNDRLLILLDIDRLMSEQILAPLTQETKA